MSTLDVGHSASDVKALDATRHRLQQLTNALTSLRRDIEISDPLPPWSTLLTSSHLLTHHVTALTSYLGTAFNSHSDSTISNFSLGGQPHAYPLPSFPFGPEKENILGQLLRKKLDPEVEEWIESASHIADSAFDHQTSAHSDGDLRVAQLNAKEQEELWAWAKPRAGEIAAGIPWSIDYTIAEVDAGTETVNTGLKRKLDDGMETDDDEDDDQDDADEDEKMVDASSPLGKQSQNASMSLAGVSEPPTMPLEDVLKFMSTGMMPRSHGTAAGSTQPGIGPR